MLSSLTRVVLIASLLALSAPVRAQDHNRPTAETVALVDRSLRGDRQAFAQLERQAESGNAVAQYNVKAKGHVARLRERLGV